MPAEELYGLATGIGSTPHTVPGEALDLIFTYLKQIPHWPQLPRRGAAEGFSAQYLTPLLKRELIAFNDTGSPCFTAADPRWDERSCRFYEMLLDEANLPEFAFPPDAAAGFYAFLAGRDRFTGETRCVKGQISGPVTVGFQVADPQGRPAFYNDALREILVKTLAEQARWQALALRELGLPVLIFIDDPGIFSYGSSAAVGLGRAEIQAGLTEIIEAVRAAGGLTGVHCCAGPDWSLLLELPLDLVSFDAYGYFPSLQVYGEALDRFLAAGGALAWGLVPASEQAMAEDASSLLRLLNQKVAALAAGGVDEARLRRQLIITPSCGLGTRPQELAERVYSLTAALAESLP
jgi:methionine synthase II (cobalamin-independent)